MQKKWFEKWFDSPYYHILYQNRSNNEAEIFIDNLFNYLNPSLNSKLLDVACGRGRHATYLNKKGFDVTGIDLSPSSIAFASQYNNKKLYFEVHDIRHIYQAQAFDLALNLFTSFGYFDTTAEHVDTLKAIRGSLKENGLLVLDYLNTEKAILDLKQDEVKHLNGIDFHITKELTNKYIIKHIRFEDKGKRYTFQEKIKAFTYVDFENLFAESDFKICHSFGDYSLNEFDVISSNRLIFICQKTNA